MPSKPSWFLRKRQGHILKVDIFEISHRHQLWVQCKVSCTSSGEIPSHTNIFMSSSRWLPLPRLTPAYPKINHIETPVSEKEYARCWNILQPHARTYLETNDAAEATHLALGNMMFRVALQTRIMYTQDLHNVWIRRRAFRNFHKSLTNQVHQKSRIWWKCFDYLVNKKS